MIKGKNLASIIGNMAKDIEEKEARISTGTVISTNPIKIRRDKLEITKDYIILSPLVQLVGLRYGDEVILLQANQQQTYYILEVIGKDNVIDYIKAQIENYVRNIAIEEATGRINALVPSMITTGVNSGISSQVPNMITDRINTFSTNLETTKLKPMRDRITALENK